MEPERVIVHDKHFGEVPHCHALVQAQLVLGQRGLESNLADHVGWRRHDHVPAGERFPVGADYPGFIGDLVEISL